METLLTVEQYATRAQLHPDSVRRQLREGRLRAVKKGRLWRIPETAIMEDSPATTHARPMKTWEQAASELAPVYADSLSNGGALTAITDAEGDLYEQAGTDAPEAKAA